MSPRLIVLVICFETIALTRCGDLWEPPSIATGTTPCPGATTSSGVYNEHTHMHIIMFAGTRAMMMGPVPIYDTLFTLLFG